jgi:ATP-dependent Clp protease adaptor protein ClpS
MEGKTITIEKNKVKTKKPKHYKVVMYNDDYTTMEFVVDVLMNIFNKKIEEANKIMMDVHRKGRGIAGIYPYDIAVTKASTAMSFAEEEGFPFKLTVEEE